MLKRRFRSLARLALAALGGVATGACGLLDVFRPAGLNDVVVRYVGSTTMRAGQRQAPVASVEAAGVPVPDPHLRFSSSDPTVLALTAVGDTLVACHSGAALLTIRVVTSMVSDSELTASDSIYVTGGPPLSPCP